MQGLARSGYPLPSPCRAFTRQGSQVRILQRPPRILLSGRGVGGTIFGLGLGGGVHLDPIWTQLGQSRDGGAEIFDVQVAVDPGRRAHVAVAEQTLYAVRVDACA